ncbi:MAG: cyclic 2,3-diphosphoglycerate synthase [candidate division WOR-3 bacterium]
MKKRVLILGAAGRDFHNFNMVFRSNPDHEVVGFTATQIPDIADRLYPPELAGELYPKGIPIYSEERLEEIIRELKVNLVVFAYSDVTHEHVMHIASRAMSAGASFMLLGPEDTTLESKRPVVAVCAVRTGSGKSQTTRRVAEILEEHGKKVVVIRHPMPYGDLRKQICQRFASFDDLKKHNCTIEEMEEYEPHIQAGRVVYAGVDYRKILSEAEGEADVILWDGGNNDFPFYKPNLLIVVADPLRPGHERRYHPGETVFRMANVILINKVDSADLDGIDAVVDSARELNPGARIILGASPVFVDDPTAIRGKRVLVIEDGPTLTHGEMGYGAGWVAARLFGAGEIVGPVPYAVGSIAEAYEKYPHVRDVLPALGYSEHQLLELEATINASPAELILSATPIDLARVIKVRKPLVRVRYDLQVIGKPNLEDVLSEKGLI